MSNIWANNSSLDLFEDVFGKCGGSSSAIVVNFSLPRQHPAALRYTFCSGDTQDYSSTDFDRFGVANEPGGMRGNFSFAFGIDCNFPSKIFSLSILISDVSSQDSSKRITETASLLQSYRIDYGPRSSHAFYSSLTRQTGESFDGQ